ncbi:myosin regulatory light chain 2, smooth muscle minor isoform-like isoform X1 [Bolinopsis microptera]|uniref:myosin regulatory light chain 2, smooth muscle minor isoform-like isoform X1 n=1 Tax=Bolinopsis microptera TaxID=2820187 RepID=UPI00307AC3E3
MSKAKGKKPQRSGSNVFANFDQQQIQEFKEAFTIIDQDRDGFISEKDLKDMWASLGVIKSDDNYFAEMMKEATGPLNFTTFLTFMGVKLQNTDSDDTLVSAFLTIDTEATGIISKPQFTNALTQLGDRFTKEEIKQMYEVAPMKGDAVDWKRFIKLIKYGGDFEEEA